MSQTILVPSPAPYHPNAGDLVLNSKSLTGGWIVITSAPGSSLPHEPIPQSLRHPPQLACTMRLQHATAPNEHLSHALI